MNWKAAAQGPRTEFLDEAMKPDGQMSKAVLGVDLVTIDLATKVMCSSYLNLWHVAGLDSTSPGLRQAAQLGALIASGGIGSEVVPAVNRADIPAHRDISMASCGGQASMPISLVGLSPQATVFRYPGILDIINSVAIRVAECHAVDQLSLGHHHPADVTRRRTVYEILKDILVDDLQARADDISPTTSCTAAGLDSLTVVELSGLLTSRLGIEIHDYELLELDTVGDIARLMEERSLANATEPTKSHP